MGKRQAKPACCHALALIRDDRFETLDNNVDHRRIAVSAGDFKRGGAIFFTVWCISHFSNFTLLFTCCPCLKIGLLHESSTTLDTDCREFDSGMLILRSLNITAVAGMVLWTTNPEFTGNSVEYTETITAPVSPITKVETSAATLDHSSSATAEISNQNAQHLRQGDQKTMAAP